MKQKNSKSLPHLKKNHEILRVVTHYANFIQVSCQPISILKYTVNAKGWHTSRTLPIFNIVCVINFFHDFLEKRWLELQYHKPNGRIMKPAELQSLLREPPISIDEHILDRIQGSIIGMALGDALGAHVEFQSRQNLLTNPVTDLVGGGTWGLQKGQVFLH